MGVSFSVFMITSRNFIYYGFSIVRNQVTRQLTLWREQGNFHKQQKNINGRLSMEKEIPLVGFGIVGTGVINVGPISRKVIPDLCPRDASGLQITGC
jgi:hypothetical protein